MPGPFDRNVCVRCFRSNPENATKRSHDLLKLIDVVLNLSEGFEVGFAEIDLLPLRAARTRDGNP